MKQCVRLTVHPSNISVSQYNVLVRAVGPGSGTWAEPSPHHKGPQPNILRMLGPAWPAKPLKSRARAPKNVSRGWVSWMCRDIGEDSLCIMGRKTRKTRSKMAQRVTERGRLLGTISLSLRWD